MRMVRLENKKYKFWDSKIWIRLGLFEFYLEVLDREEWAIEDCGGSSWEL